MIDLELATEKRLSNLTERLRERDPLSIPKEDFLEEVKAHVAERLPERSKALSTEHLVSELRSVSHQQKHQIFIHSVGTVEHVGNGIATLSGLPMVHLEELVVFPNGVEGMVLNLDRKHVDVILLGDDKGIRGGDVAIGTGKRLSIPVGTSFLGRVVDPLGNPMDETRAIIPSEYRSVERIAPGVIDRAPVDTPLFTGTKIIDTLLPLGRGQRELIVGDRQVGKTTLALDAILSQKGTDVRCVYVSIGQRKTSVLSALETLKAGGVLNQTIVMVSSPDDPPALRYLAPYAGVTMAEYLLDNGMDVLIVYDDLSKHADTYREMSLLLRRPPGREAYPGDIFYLHSRLLERACRLNEANGSGSITALPIVTTQRGDISSYIVTNLISITDGQIVLDANEFNKGNKPAIDVGKSVSRVGSAAQESAMKSVVKALKLELSQYEEVARFARFGTEVNEATRKQIERGQRLNALLRQGPNQPVRFEDQVVQFFVLTNGFMDDIKPDQVPAFTDDMLGYLHNHAPQAIDAIKHERSLSEETKADLKQALGDFFHLWEKKEKQNK